jgi:YVTN family beta-propeller protein
MALGRHRRPAGTGRARLVLSWVAAATAVAVALAAFLPELLEQARADRDETRVERAQDLGDDPAESPSPSHGPAVTSKGGQTASRKEDAKQQPGRTRTNLYAADGPGHLSRAVVGIRPRVYVPNTLDGTVDVIDPQTFRVTKRLRVGGEPHHITPSWDLRRLYVDNPGNGTLAVIDPKTASITKRIRVASPYNLYFTPDGKKALVVSEDNRLIEFRNPHTWRLIKRVRIPWPGVDHMDFSADGRFLLVSCEYSGIVVRVNTTRMAVSGTLFVGGRPIDVKASPTGRVFYVANQGLCGVTVVDPIRLRKISFIHTGVGAHGFAVSRDGKHLYVSNRIASTISVISFATRKVVATWHVGGSPDMLQVSPNGKQLWTSNRFGTTVSVVSTETGRVTHTITVGRQPHGLAYFPQPGRFSLGHNGVYR